MRKHFSTNVTKMYLGFKKKGGVGGDTMTQKVSAEEKVRTWLEWFCSHVNREPAADHISHPKLNITCKSADKRCSLRTELLLGITASPSTWQS